MLEGPVSTQEVYKYWYNKLVPTYSTRELTKLNDRLPALSGLSSKFALRLNDKYLAGLWERDLITGLRWSTRRPGHNLLERAPSWSWASVEGPIDFYEEWELGGVEMSLEVLDAQVVTNPTGMVRKGSLRVSGMMCMAFLNVEPLIFNKEQWYPRHSHYKCSLIRKGFESERDAIIVADVFRGPALKLDTPLSVAVLNTSKSESLHSLQRSFDDPAQYPQKVSGNVLCVLLYQRYIEDLGETERGYLILGASYAEIGVYHRLGTVTVGSGEHSHIWFEDMNKDAIIIR
jgi:hypothetical protein